MNRLRALMEGLLELVFPDRCAACGGAGGLLCPACLGRLSPYPPDEPTAGLDGMTVAWLYEGPIRKAVHTMKYRRRRRVADVLGDALAARVAAPPADALVPVPLHASRMAERGFNQAEALARRLGHRWGLPVCADGLERGRDTEHQARLSRGERRTNVAGAFVWRGPGRPPARVLLVDDVLTTGATLAACAEALRAAGTREVRAVALARSLAHPAGTACARMVKSAQQPAKNVWRNDDVRAEGADPGSPGALGAAMSLAEPGAGPRTRCALHDDKQRPGRAAVHTPRSQG